MRSIEVPVKFEGTVTVSVPDELSDLDAHIFAEKYALAKIVAVTDTLDTEDVELKACEELERELLMSACTVDKRWGDTGIQMVVGKWTRGEEML